MKKLIGLLAAGVISILVIGCGAPAEGEAGTDGATPAVETPKTDATATPPADGAKPTDPMATPPAEGEKKEGEAGAAPPAEGEKKEGEGKM